MNSEPITDHLAFANRSVPNADGLLYETEACKPVETAARAFPERHCELFEGGLGI
jgi:hypothetical protein